MSPDHERVIGEPIRLTPKRVGPLTRADFVQYAGASGDFNPMHFDDEFARSAGYPSVFGMGLLTAGIAAGHIAALFGSEHVRSFSVRYTDQVWPGDTLVLEGEVEGAEPDAEGRISCTFSVRRDAGSGPEQVVLQCSARVELAALDRLGHTR